MLYLMANTHPGTHTDTHGDANSMLAISCIFSVFHMLSVKQIKYRQLINHYGEVKFIVP